MTAVAVDLRTLALERRATADVEAAAHQQQQFAETRARNAERGLRALRRLLELDGLAPADVDATVASAKLLGPDDPSDEAATFEISGLLLRHDPDRDGEYAPGFYLLETCGHCHLMPAAKRPQVRSLYQLGQALEAPPPAACEACWPQVEAEREAAMPAERRLSVGEELERLIWRIVDERLPENP